MRGIGCVARGARRVRPGGNEELNYTIARLSHSGALLGLGGSNHGQGPGRRIGKGNKRRSQAKGRQRDVALISY